MFSVSLQIPRTACALAVLLSLSGYAAANTAPVANAGVDQKVAPGALVQLDGVASSDADSNPLTYKWTLVKPAGSAAMLSGTTLRNPTFIADFAGTYTAKLVVNDGTVNSVNDAVKVNANTRPVANAGPDKNGTLFTSVALSGALSSDVDGDTLTYSWTLSAKPLGSLAVLNGATTVAPTFTPDLVGSYVAKLVVRDGKISSVADSIKVSASAPPIIELATNGGFQTAATLPNQFAFAWRGVNNNPATLATEGRTSNRSASLAIALQPNGSGLPGGSGIAHNSIEDGLQPSIQGLYTGKLTRLTFWAKGNPSQTGVVNYSLRYLAANGAILNPVVNTPFGASINPNTWTQISYVGPAIPAAAVAMFIEMTLAAGPSGLQPGLCGDTNGVPNPCDWGQAKVLIDDLSIEVLN